MFYKQGPNGALVHPESPASFGAVFEILPTPEDIIKFAGWYWFDSEEDAYNAFGIPENQ